MESWLIFIVSYIYIYIYLVRFFEKEFIFQKYFFFFPKTLYDKTYNRIPYKSVWIYIFKLREHEGIIYVSYEEKKISPLKKIGISRQSVAKEISVAVWKLC